ncbi:MAG: fused MFS/spermidine synthase [Egibacteraceae bacterium]
MPPIAAALLVFCTSAAVLVLEILAGRLLAPYVGVTLETYTGIIGVVLAGIALGNWLGGRAADRVDPRKTLGPLLVVGGTFALCTVPAIRLFGALGLGAGPIGITTLALVGFFGPATALSAVSPTVVKLQLADLDQTGRVVGRLSALGTAGAILGTFVTGFVLVAAVPTPPIVLTLGVLLVAAGVLVWAWLGRGAGAQLPVTALLLAGLGAGLALLLPSPCEFESAYFCARVVPDPGRLSGRTLWLDRLRHSYVDLADPTHLEFSYARIMSDVIASIAPERQPITALHIGGGGFSLPRYLAAVRPGSFSRVLELDPTLVRIARTELGLRTGPNLQVRIGDARLGLADEPADRYDLVIGDAFGGQAVPWHLTTSEFIGEVKRTLRPGGVYALNLIDNPPLSFARAELATMRAAFQRVALIAPPDHVRGAAGGNFVLVGSDERLEVEAVQQRNRDRGDHDLVVWRDADLDAFTARAHVLTDDYAPVDQLLTPLT